MRHLSHRAFLGLSLLGLAAASAPAATVPVNFNPNGFAYSYWINGTNGPLQVTGTRSFDATVGETYTVRTRGNVITVGTFSVDADGNFTESAPGLASPSAGNIQFDNATITFNRGSAADYGFFLDWLAGGVQQATWSTPIPRGSGDWVLWANGFQDPDNLVTYSIDADGNAGIVSVASDGPYTTAGSTINFPTPTSIAVDAPASLGAYDGAQAWGIHWITGSFGVENFNDRALPLIPGKWGLISSGLPAGSWKTGLDRIDVPGDVATAPWTQTLTWVVTADGTEHDFVFTGPVPIPEPAALAFLSLAALPLLRRRA